MAKKVCAEIRDDKFQVRLTYPKGYVNTIFDGMDEKKLRLRIEISHDLFEYLIQQGIDIDKDLRHAYNIMQYWIKEKEKSKKGGTYEKNPNS